MKTETGYEPINVLLVEDDEDDYLLTRKLFSKFQSNNYKLSRVSNYADGLETIRDGEPQVCLIDYRLGERNGIELIRAAQNFAAPPSMILLTGQDDFDVDVEAMASGAVDYLVKTQTNAALLERTIRYAVKRRRIEEDLIASRRQYESLVHSVEGIVWEANASDLKFTFVSRQAERLLGYPTAQWLDEPDFWINRLHPEDRLWVVDSCRKSTERLEKHRLDYRMIARDGRVVWVQDIVTIEVKDGAAQLRGIMVDVTERTQIAEERERFFNVSLDMLCIVDENGFFERINPAWMTTLGCTEEELMSKPYIERVHPDDKARTVAIAETLSEGKDIISFENRYLCKDGSYKWLMWNSTPIDEHQLIYAVAHDITKRKLGEQMLRESKEQVTNILESITDAFYALDRDWNFTYVNRAAENLIMRTSADLCGKNIWSEFPAAAAADSNFNKMFRRAMDENVAVDFVEFYPEPFSAWYGVHAYPSKSGISVYLSDITRRKKAEDALTEANERAIREYEKLIGRVAQLAETLGSARDLLTIYRALQDFAVVSTAASGFFVTLYDAREKMRIPSYICLNDEEIDVSELPSMPVTNSPLSRAVMTGEVVITDDFQKAIAGQPTVNIGLDKDPCLPQSSLATPMSVMGRIVGAIELQSTELAAFKPGDADVMQLAANLAANAIENVRLLEQERQHNEKLRQSQKLESVGRLAGGIAHDFNNMLTAINGYSSMILRKLEPDDPLRPSVQEIKKAGERSSALTHQLLAFSRQQVMQPKILDINETVTDTTGMLQRLIGEDIQLNIALSPNVGQVKADPGQLSQVIMNLAVNARDAMPGGGRLTIETSNVSLDKSYVSRHGSIESGDYVMLAVSDTGTGMDEETRQHIFEPFYTTKEIGKGTGLGLATVYGIVQQTGGCLWVYSEIGYGTTFKIYLPRIEREVKIEDPVDLPFELLTGTETILLVEDEEMVRNLAREMLEECGYTILEAADGVEALGKVAEAGGKIDLLITDVVMPEMSGRILAEKLAETYPRMPVLFISGYTNDSILLKDIEDEANFVQKPFNFEQLSGKVRRTLDAAFKS